MGRSNVSRLQQWSQDRGAALQTLGLLALAGGAGMLVGVIAAKALWAVKGAGAVGAALAPFTVGASVGGATGVGVMRGRLRRATAQRDQQIAETQAARAVASRAQRALSSAEAQLDQLQSQLAAAAPTADPLQAIQGIGPVFARRLHAGGIHSLADLAAATPEQVRAAVAGLRGGKLANVQEWIDQARQRLAA